MAEGLRRICLVGVRGVGKTTLIRSIVDELPHVDYIIGSSLLRQFAGDDFARFDHLPHEVKHAYRERVIEWMVERQAREGRHILCDGHTALLDESTGEVGPVFTERDCRFYDELMLLDAPMEVILDRRLRDTTKRRSTDPKIIAEELSAERSTCRQIAERWGMRLHVLPPNVGSQARDRMLELLR